MRSETIATLKKMKQVLKNKKDIRLQSSATPSKTVKLTTVENQKTTVEISDSTSVMNRFSLQHSDVQV